MSLGLRRELAVLACRGLQIVLPSQLQSWGWAVRYEVAETDDDTEALLFAMSALGGLAPRAIAVRLFQLLAIVAGDDVFPSSGGATKMAFFSDAVRNPRLIGIICAVGAATLGIAYMALAGAPIGYLGINAGALVIGLALLAAIGGAGLVSRRWPGAITLMVAVALLATALLGSSVEGAARWIRLGPLFIQPSFALLPVMIMGFVRSPNRLSMVGMVVAAIALAIQPDRAMSGMMVAGLTVLAVARPDRLVIPAFIGSVIGFAVTLARADTLPAAPYVDQIFYTSFDVHVAAGLAVLGGSVLLLVPAIIGRLYDLDNREAHLAFGAVWFAAIIAAALGNYPTPLVGYGGSAVIGYVLSLAMLPKVIRSRVRGEITSGTEAKQAYRPDRQLCIGPAQSLT